MVEVEDIGNVITPVRIRRGAKEILVRLVGGRVDVTIRQFDLRPGHIVAGMATAVALACIAGTVDLSGADMEAGTGDISGQHFVGGWNRPDVPGHCDGPGVRSRHRVSLFRETIDQRVRVGPGKQQVRYRACSAERRDVVGLVCGDGLSHSVDGQSG